MKEQVAGSVMSYPGTEDLGQRASILLVDDREENLIALEAILKDLGQGLVKAGSGQEALRLLFDRDFAVILLDVRMPEMDGFETAELIRKRQRSRHTPIIFITAADANPGQITRGYSVGAVDYLFKPFMPEVLKAKVRIFLDLRKAKEELESRVRERTAELEKANDELQAEIAHHSQTEQQLRVSFQQLRALAARLQTVREQERTRIAREIHDEFGQALTAIKMDFTYLIGRLPDNGKQFQERTNSILKLTDDTIQNVRRIAAELRPGMLDDLGLAAAIEWQAQEFGARAGIRCLVDLPEDGVSFDRDRSTAIFRIFQETLTNVARHAQAKRVDVRLEQGATELTLEVRDDGKGIEAGKIQDSKSLGLLGMRERALILGGTLEVKGSKGEGTTLRVRVPVERRKTARPDQGNAQDPHR